MPLADYRSRIDRALEYAREHLGENPDLRDLAAAAAFSPYHFHRIFTAMTGETPAAHVRRLRLEKAANSLRSKPDAPITRIALDCGFASPSAFSRDFRARFGLAPQAYRERPNSARGPEKARPSPIGDEGGPAYRLETFMPARLAYCTHTGPYGPGVGKAWKTLMGWAAPRGLAGPQAKLYGISWDSPETTEGRKLRYDACLAVPPETEASAEVRVRDLPAYRCIVLPFKGPERRLSRAYARLYYRILPESGFEPDDFPAFEHYLSMPSGFLIRRFDLEIHLPIRVE